jgi:hypothetical protein
VESLRRYLASFVPILLVGALVRTYHLGGQLIIGDEWHALHRALLLHYSDLLTSFGISDHSILLALYFRAVMDTLGLSETLLRAPFLLAGLLALVLIPAMIRREAGDFVAVALGWLLALSPLLVLYSRYARPYAVTLLCAWTGALAVREWWRTGRRGFAATYWACTVLAGYFLVISLPFLLGALLFLFVEGCRRRPQPPLPGLPDLLRLGFLTAATLAALLLPALITDYWSLSGHAPGPVTRAGISAPQGLAAYQVLAGHTNPAGSWIVGVLALLGVVRGLRRASGLVVFVLTLCGLQILAVDLALPAFAWPGFFIARYLLFVLPALLMFVAMGIEAAVALAPRARPVLRGGLAAVLATTLFAWGPLPGALLGPPNWVTQQLLSALTYHEGFYPTIIRRVPAFYRRLGRAAPGSLTIVEVPSYTVAVTSPFARYQSVHHQRTLIGFHNGLCGHLRKGEVPWGATGMRLRNYVFLASPEAVLGAGATHVVFHKRVSREALIQPVLIYDEPDLSNCIAAYRSRFGDAVYEDEDIVAFDLRKGRGEPW